MKIFIIYLIIVNIYALIIMYKDKVNAKKRKWRVPESKLFLIALAFGSLGILLGMNLFHHKTKHLKFTILIPLILFVQAILLYNILL